MIDISIDLETLSSDPRGASIAAIGLAAEDFATGQRWEWYRVVHDPTGIIDPKTVRWHVQQRSVDSLGRHEDAMELEPSLRALREMLRGHLKSHREGEARVWTHATFDAPQLACAYQRAGIDFPWFRRNSRDLRTLYDLAGGRPTVEHAGKHHALNDARAQLEEVRICLGRLGRL